MTIHRERMPATLLGRPTDCIPFVPRVDLWHSASKYSRTLPDRYRKATLPDIVDDLDAGCHTASAGPARPDREAGKNLCQRS